MLGNKMTWGICNHQNQNEERSILCMGNMRAVDKACYKISLSHSRGLCYSGAKVKPLICFSSGKHWLTFFFRFFSLSAEAHHPTAHPHTVSGKRTGIEREGRTPAAVILGCYKKTDFVALSRILLSFTFFTQFYNAAILQSCRSNEGQSTATAVACTTLQHSPFLGQNPLSSLLLHVQLPYHLMQGSDRLHVFTSERYKDQGSNQSYGHFKYIALFFHSKPKQNTKAKKPTQHQKPVIHPYSTDFFHYESSQATVKLEAKPQHQYICALETMSLQSKALLSDLSENYFEKPSSFLFVCIDSFEKSNLDF